MEVNNPLSVLVIIWALSDYSLFVFATGILKTTVMLTCKVIICGLDCARWVQISLSTHKLLIIKLQLAKKHIIHS